MDTGVRATQERLPGSTAPKGASQSPVARNTFLTFLSEYFPILGNPDGKDAEVSATHAYTEVGGRVLSGTNTEGAIAEPGGTQRGLTKSPFSQKHVPDVSERVYPYTRKTLRPQPPGKYIVKLISAC